MHLQLVLCLLQLVELPESLDLQLILPRRRSNQVQFLQLSLAQKVSSCLERG